MFPMLFALVALAGFYPDSSMAQPEVSVPSPVFLDGRPIGQIVVYPAGGGFFVQKDALISLLRGKIRGPQLSALEAESGSRVSLAALKIDGLNVLYDEENLVVRISIAAEARETNVISFRGPPAMAGRTDIRRPSAVSGYLNLRASDQWDQPNFLNEFTEGPLILDTEAVLNVLGAVVESRWDYNEENRRPWRRRDLRVTWDHEASATRFSAGDLNYGVLGFQSFRPIGGLSVAKNYSIQPYLVTSPVARNKIFLNRDSSVRIFVNGAFFREIRLAAGEHDLRDLPLVRGVNQIEIEIEDDLGRRERLAFPFVSEAELLRQGLHQYGYNVGAPVTETESGKSYEDGEAAFSFFHRYGFFDNLTSGLYAQGDDLLRMLGQETVLGTSWGLFALDVASSEISGFGDSWAGRLRYRYLEDSTLFTASRNFGFSVESIGRRFAGLGVTAPDNRFMTNWEASYSQPLWERMRLGLSYRYQYARDDAGDRRVASVNGSYYGWRGQQLSVDVSRSNDAGGGQETQFFVSWLWTGLSARDFVLSNYNSLNRNVSAEYQHSGFIGNSQYDVSATLASGDQQDDVGFEFDYIGKRMLVLASHNRFFPKEELLTDGARTRLTFGTALAFAGTSWALSRPIADSFVILSAKPHLHDQRIPVNSQGVYADAEIGFFESAILPGLTSYHYEQVNLDTSYLEPGYQLGEENFVVLPTYRSGSSVTVGTDATLFVEGRLVDAAGLPLALQAGEVHLEEGADGGRAFSPVVFFTNRKGEFRIEGLLPGRFTLKLFDEAWQPATFELSRRQAGIVSIGKIRMKAHE